MYCDYASKISPASPKIVQCDEKEYLHVAQLGFSFKFLNDIMCHFITLTQ